MRKIIVLGLSLLLPPGLAAQTFSDTLWSVPQLDGLIAFRPGSGIFNISTNGSSLIAGDGFDWFLQEEVFSRSYLSFDLEDLFNPDPALITQAIIGVYQFDCSGNSQPGVYPIWNVAGGDTHFCVLDHINYGSSLDLGDWTAGDPGDPQTLQTNIGVISDNAVVEYKIMGVTQYVKEDLNQGRTYNQYRLRFTIDRDFDNLNDQLNFKSGNTLLGNVPYLIVYYSPVSITEGNTRPIEFQLLLNYPNPFNPTTTIKYDLSKLAKIKLEIFNILGQWVITLFDGQQAAGFQKILWDGRNQTGAPVSSGMYIYRLTATSVDGKETFTKEKKMILIK